jgi:FixJ family two-component response regulator
MTEDQPIIYVLDDDHRVRAALSSLLSSFGLRVEAFASAGEYLQFVKPDVPGCLILDLELPGMNGLELQQELAGGDSPPIVFCHGARRCAFVRSCYESWSDRVSTEAF